MVRAGARVAGARRGARARRRAAAVAQAPRRQPAGARAARPAGRGVQVTRRRVLILVENLPSPFDRRVWQEATALRDAGYAVSIVCPTGRGYERRYESIDGI